MERTGKITYSFGEPVKVGSDKFYEQGVMYGDMWVFSTGDQHGYWATYARPWKDGTQVITTHPDHPPLEFLNNDAVVRYLISVTRQK